MSHFSPRGELRLQEPLAKHTTWRVGGPAQRFFIPADLADLRAYLEQLPPTEPLFWLGMGSNLLVRDGGLPGSVILTLKGLKACEALDERHWRIEAGASCAKVARDTARAGLSGAEFLAGIPGSFGGALAMNAGAFGGETWPLVRSVETLDRQGRLRQRPASDYRIGYRSVQGPPGERFIAATLALEPAQDDSGAQRIRALLEQRKQSQPIGLPSCGSVFRNPPGDHAARLIQAAGLKGERLGGAQVSPKHANFIINTGNARAADIEALILKVRMTVEKRFGVCLQPEVKIVGQNLDFPFVSFRL